ncbi:MAG: hypothetical protein Kow00127_01660 [Bacteroidales bacterium]
MWLKEHYPVFSLNNGLRLLRSGQLRETVVAITFDDGHRLVQTDAVPILEKLRIPATIFINTAYLEGKLPGYWFNIGNYLLNDPELSRKVPEDLASKMTRLRETDNPEEYRRLREEVESLAELLPENINFYVDREWLQNVDPGLINVGLHGHEHQRFSMMPYSWQKNNIEKCYIELAELPGFVPLFALPFGKPSDCNPETIEIVREHKLEFIYSYGGYNAWYHQAAINRIPADGRDIRQIMETLQYYTKRRMDG